MVPGVPGASGVSGAPANKSTNPSFAHGSFERRNLDRYLAAGRSVLPGGRILRAGGRCCFFSVFRSRGDYVHPWHKFLNS